MASVTAVDSSHYTIVVNPTPGLASGSVALSLVAGGATDAAGNVAVAANLASLDSQPINTLAPTVVAVTDNVAGPVANGPISFTATFSEAVTGVSATSFTATDGTVASVTAVDSSHYTIVVNPTPGLASGSVALSLVAGGATDAAGNVAVAANLASLDSQPINTLAPTVVAVADNVAGPVANGPISFTATFSEAVTGVSATSFATDGTVASVTAVDSSHYTIVVNPTPGLASGSVALSLVAGGATDAAGNVAVAANLADLDSQPIDTLAPTVAITISSTTLTASNNTATVTFASAKHRSFSLSDTTATGGTLSNLQQTDATHWTALFTANSNTQVTKASVRVTAGSYQDAAGNLALQGAAEISPSIPSRIHGRIRAAEAGPSRPTGVPGQFRQALQMLRSRPWLCALHHYDSSRRNGVGELAHDKRSQCNDAGRRNAFGPASLVMSAGFSRCRMAERSGLEVPPPSR